MVVDDDNLDTPEKRRAWIESVSGLGGRNEIFEKLAASMRPLMKKGHVIAATAKVLDGVPVEKDGAIWIGQYYFTFDENDRLETGPNYVSGSGGVKIGSEFR